MTAEQQVEARKRGSPKDTIRSARTIELIEMLEQNAPGWDPVIYLAKIAAGLIHTEEATLENRMDAARAVMPYLRPKLAAVSVELNSTETKVRRLVIEGLHQSMQAEALLEGEAVEP